MESKNQKAVCEKKGTFRTLKVRELKSVSGGCPEIVVQCPTIVIG